MVASNISPDLLVIFLPTTGIIHAREEEEGEEEGRERRRKPSMKAGHFLANYQWHIPMLGLKCHPCSVQTLGGLREDREEDRVGGKRRGGLGEEKGDERKVGLGKEDERRELETRWTEGKRREEREDERRRDQD